MTPIQIISSLLLLLIFVTVVLRFTAPYIFQRLFDKYAQSHAKINGAKAARQMLKHHGIENVIVSVWPFDGPIQQCYDASMKTVFLRYEVYHSHSVSAIAIACHEAAHAIQHAEDFKGIWPLAIVVEYDANKKALAWMGSDLARSVGALNKWVTQSRNLLRWSLLTYIF
jgi:Zn-dependent membrane protease YugP